MPEHSNIAAALVAALADLSVVGKGRKANAGSYSYEYASIEDVVRTTRPVLAEHGIVVLTPVHDHGSGLACTVVLLHTSGERLDFGPFPFPHGKDAQATGSMVTYHRRYALVSALGMAAGDDDDGQRAVPRPAASPSEPLADETEHAMLRQAIATLDETQAPRFREWWQSNRLPSIKSADTLTVSQAKKVWERLEWQDKPPADSQHAEFVANGEAF